MASNRPSGFRNRRTQVVTVLGLLVIVGALAIPRLTGASDESPTARRDRRASDPAGEPDARTADAGGKSADTATRGSAGRVAVERIEPAADDLQVILQLRWGSYLQGSAIKARVDVVNCDEQPVWIPAADEPHTTLTIRVLDENGDTVRRINEESDSPMPRRMRRIGPGESARWEIDVVARGEKPLPPGHYQLAAVFEADRAWRRTGLPVWTAPKGARHSGRVTFDVTAR